LDLVRSAGPIEVSPEAGYETATLRIPVEEPRQFAFEGAAGLAGDDSESRDLLWSLRVRVNSLFGYGRSLTLHTERPDRGRHDLTLGYRRPLFVLGPGWLSANLSTRDYRDQFYEFAAKGSASASLARGLELGFELGWKTVSPEAARPSFERYDLAVTFDGYDLDERLNPSSGWHTNWRLIFSYRRYHEDTLAAVPGMTALEETRAQLLVARYQPVLQRLLLHLELNYDGLQTQEDLPPVSELTLLGGPTTIRGFRSEQFIALQAAWGTVEPRIRYRWGFVGTFIDMAYLRNRVARNEGVITEERFEYGYGIGLGLTGSRGGISVSLAWNPQLAFDQPYLAVRFNSEL
jgi:outer membrane protein assembly factor BamA